MQHIKRKIQKRIQQALYVLFKYEISLESIRVEEGKREEYGDYTTNIALHIAKEFKKKPIDLANEILKEIEKKDYCFENIDIVNSGFINFFLKAKGLHELLDFKEEEEEELNKIQLKKLLKVKNFKSKLSLDEIKSVQYVHSRTCSIIKIFEEEGVCIQGTKEKIDYEVNHIEKIVIKKLIEYPCVRKQVITCNNPEKIIQYMFELSDLFYKFHEKILFRKLDKKRLSVNLKIIDNVRIIIQEILNDISIDAPQKM